MTFIEETPFRFGGEYLACEDFDKDGNLDLAIAGPDILRIYINNTDGTFRIGFTLLEYEHYGPLASGDFDNDGDFDLAIGNPESGRSSYLLVNQTVPNPQVTEPIPVGPLEVWVDDDWDNYSFEDFIDGHTFGVDAFSKIQDGIIAVASSGNVYVAAGTYKENINFLGKSITVKSISGSENTIIDGDDIGSAVTFETKEGLDSILNGFTITNSRGSGIRCYKGSATIMNNIIRDNAGTGIGLFKSKSIIKKYHIWRPSV